MEMHFSQKNGRENFIKCSGGEENLKVLESYFQPWPFSIKEENALKRFFVREPKGRDILIHFLKHSPGLPLQIMTSSGSLSGRILIGEQLFCSKFYVLKLSKTGFFLVEDNTKLMDLEKYVF